MSVASLANLSSWKPDRAKILASQLASKGYFAGEAAGLRLASREGRNTPIIFIIAPDQ
jgi:phosphatidylinositol 4-kinase